MKHAEFHISYIWVALATALGAGFAMGAYMALAIGHRLRRGLLPAWPRPTVISSSWGGLAYSSWV
jgi:hypothetical protein